MAIFNSYVSLPEGISMYLPFLDTLIQPPIKAGPRGDPDPDLRLPPAPAATAATAATAPSARARLAVLGSWPGEEKKIECDPLVN